MAKNIKLLFVLLIAAIFVVSFIGETSAAETTLEEDLALLSAGTGGTIIVVTPDQMTYRECMRYYTAEGCERLCAYGKIDCGQYW